MTADPPSVLEFKTRVETFVDRLLAGHTVRETKSKIVHDALWGTTRYEPWEVAVMDSPLLQRLRHIHQTGLAYLLYPTACHTRFDHSLGVVSVVSRVVVSLNARCKPNHPVIEHSDEVLLRLAALLHDVGHCLFSHVSEIVYEQTDEFTKFRRWLNDKYHVTPKGHEALSYLIVSSQRFGEFYSEVHTKCGLSPLPPSLEVVAELIIGHSRDPLKEYLTEIINGTIDADKLDYLARDAHFAGVTVAYDIERYMQTVAAYYDKGTAKLHLPITGIAALEQILLSKMTLYACLYHHHKVRAAEGMMKRACCLAKAAGVSFAVDGVDVVLDHPCDYLDVTESHVALAASSNAGWDTAPGIWHKIASRDLMKRALIISRLFTEGVKDNTDANALTEFFRLMADCKEIEGCERLADRIHKRMIEKLPAEQREAVPKKIVLVDIPKGPDVEEATAAEVPVTADGKRRVELERVFPLTMWAEGYATVQWKGHVFAPDGWRWAANAAAIEVIGEEYGLRFDEMATLLCGMPASEQGPRPVPQPQKPVQYRLEIDADAP